MGELINLARWKKKKADEAHEKELEEIRALKEELSAQIEEMGEIEVGPYMSEEEKKMISKELSSWIALDRSGHVWIRICRQMFVWSGFYIPPFFCKTTADFCILLFRKAPKVF